MSQDTTQLFVHCHGLDEKAEQKIADLMDGHGFPVTSAEGTTGEVNTLMTNGFVNDDQNKANIDSLFERIKKNMKLKKLVGISVKDQTTNTYRLIGYTNS